MMMKQIFLSFSVVALLGTVALAQKPQVMWGKFNAVSPHLNQIGVLEVQRTEDIGPSLWSIGCETLDRDFADLQNYKQYVGELGAKSARIQSGWAKCEREKGEYDFGWLDTVVDDLRAEGAQPWMVLCYGNPLYGSDKNLRGRIFTDDATMTAWLNYVRATVRHYKDRVTEWEIWNEPNLGSNVKYPSAYANLLMKTAEVVKEEQPHAVIIGFALSGIPIDFARDVFEILKANGKADIVDYLSFHPYARNPDGSRDKTRQMEEMAKSYNPEIKLFQGETGCPANLEWGHALRNYPWTEVSQAKWLMRRMANDWDLGMRSNIFTMIDLQYYDMLQSFGLLRANLEKKVMYKRPSFYAVQHMINVLQANTTSAGALRHRTTSNRDLQVRGIVKDGKSIGTMLWYADEIPSDVLEWDRVDVTIDNLNLRDPVLIEVITGKVYSLEPQRYAFQNIGESVKLMEIPVWDSPMLVVERDAVDFKSR